MVSRLVASCLAGVALLMGGEVRADGAKGEGTRTGRADGTTTAPGPRAGFAAPCPAGDVEEGDRTAAKGLHRAAEAYFRDERYTEALDAWRDAYRHDCSAHRLLINIGNSLDRLARPDDAVRAFEAFIAREGLRPPDDEGGRPHPAFARLEDLRARARAPAPKPVTRPAPTVAPTAPPPAAPPLVPWLLVGGGSATVLTGIGLLVGGAVVQRDAHDDCDQLGACPPGVLDDGRFGRQLQQGGGVAAVAGLGLVTAGTLWLLLDDEAPADVEADIGLGHASLRLRF